MNIWLVLNLLGGLAIFLYGMIVMNENIVKVAGQKLKKVLISLTGSNIRGILTGLGVTSVIQSSSATTVMVVGLIGAGLLTYSQSLGVILGAEIGTTITAQLVAFKLTKYALLICAVGFFSSFICKTKKAKSIAGTILGFGLLFLGMDIMSKALSPLRSYEPFLQMMRSVEKPLFGILVGLVFTLIVQSSSATSGIVVAMAISGTITLSQAIPINLGASIGTSITAILGSLTLNRDAKRAAWSHTFSQTLGVILVYILLIIPFKDSNLWIYFTKWFTKTFVGTEDLARQIAMAHTLMPTLKTLLVLPLIPIFAKLAVKIYPSKEEEKPFGPMYISDSLLDAPTFALEAARKEILREGEIAKDMLAEVIEVFNCRDIKSCELLSMKDVKLDILHNAVVPYLTKIGQMGLTPEQAREQTGLLYMTADIEAIGDIIDKNIMPLARKKFENKLWFSDEGWQDIVKLHEQVLSILEKALTSVKDNNKELAQVVVNSKPIIGALEGDMRKKHISRLNSGLQESLETSSIHIDLIDQFKRINSHTVAIGYVVLEQI